MLCKPEPAQVEERSAVGEAATRLRHEARILQHARHPGVVELVELREAEDGTVSVVTALIAGQALAGQRFSVSEVARVMAVLATTVADLHEVGVAVGALDQPDT